MDSDITFSSVYDEKSNNARLFFKYIPKVNTGGWRALANERRPWLKVDFQEAALIVAVATQGIDPSPFDPFVWTKSYSLTYRNSGGQFITYKSNKVRSFISLIFYHF